MFDIEDLPPTEEMLLGLLLRYEIELSKDEDMYHPTPGGSFAKAAHSFRIEIRSDKVTLSASFFDQDEAIALRKTIGSVYRQATALANLSNQGKI